MSGRACGKRVCIPKQTCDFFIKQSIGFKFSVVKISPKQPVQLGNEFFVVTITASSSSATTRMATATTTTVNVLSKTKLKHMGITNKNNTKTNWDTSTLTGVHKHHKPEKNNN